MQMLIYSKILENGLSITFKTYGYCYLKNHGIDENLLNEYSRVSKSFFEQPESFDFLRKLHGKNLHRGQLEFSVWPGKAGEHTDWGMFTFNFQDSTGGWEVQTPDGEIVAANPIPGTCVVTPSILLQRWTSDKIKGSVHRVMVPKDERRKKVRQSLIFFVNPDDDVEVKCLDGSDKYPPVLVKDYWGSRAKYSQKYDWRIYTRLYCY